MEPIHPVQKVDPISTERFVDRVSRAENYTEKSKGDLKDNLLSDSALERAVKEANEYMVGVNAEFRILKHEGTGRDVVQLLDMQTDEVIKEFPPRELLDVVAGIWKQAGIVIDRTE